MENLLDLAFRVCDGLLNDLLQCFGNMCRGLIFKEVYFIGNGCILGGDIYVFEQSFKALVLILGGIDQQGVGGLQH